MKQLSILPGVMIKGDKMMNLSLMSLEELKEICQKCHLKDECGECRLPIYREDLIKKIQVE